MESIYLVRFYFDNSVMKELEIPGETVAQAIKIAMDTIGGYVSWDKIKVEKK